MSTPPPSRRPKYAAGRTTATTIRRRQVIAAVLVAVVALSTVAGLVHNAEVGASAATSATGTPSNQPTSSNQPRSGPSGRTGDGRTASSSTTSTTSGAATSSATSTAVVERRSGSFTPVTLAGTPAPTGRVVTIGLEVEGGLGADNAAIAATVAQTLLDPRGWQGTDKISIHLMSAQQLATGTKPTVTVTIASPAMVDKLCAPMRTEGEFSCGNSGRAVLNYKRWVDGVPYYGSDLVDYRRYLINHEVGHILGHGHQSCAGKGEKAPVMQQQTKGLQGCTAWPWPSR